MGKFETVMQTQEAVNRFMLLAVYWRVTGRFENTRTFELLCFFRALQTALMHELAYSAHESIAGLPQELHFPVHVYTPGWREVLRELRVLLKKKKTQWPQSGPLPWSRVQCPNRLFHYAWHFDSLFVYSLEIDSNQP